MLDRAVTTGLSDWVATHQMRPSASTVEKMMPTQGERRLGETEARLRGSTSCLARP